MDWTKVLTIIGVNVAILSLFATLFMWLVNKIDVDVKSIASQVDSLGKRMDAHACRIDQLYTMFVQLLKETKK